MIPRFKPWLGWAEFRTLFRRNRGAVKRFEREFARTFGAVDAVAFPHGRSALWGFFKAIGISDAEIVLPAYTCSVVAHAISLSGNRPRFVDIRLSDYNMDLDLLPAAINENTRAVIATHLFGYPLDLSRLESIIAEAEAKYGQKIWLIQDCAHSFGATWNGRLVGESGDVALYALNISKMMTSIFGGILTFRERTLASQVRSLRDAQFRSHSWLKPLHRRLYLLAVYVAFSRPVYALTRWLQECTPVLDRLTKSYHLDDRIAFPPGYDCQMLDIDAAVGLEQIKKYHEIIARRRANAAYYDGHLKRPNWILPPLMQGATYSHYVIRVPDRKEAKAHMSRQGIELGELIQYSVPNLNSYKIDGEHFDNALIASCCTINLPLQADLSEKDLRMVVDACNR